MAAEFTYAGERWARSFALACQDLDLDRCARLALISHAVGRPVASAKEVDRSEMAACWRVLFDYRDWRLEVFATDAGRVVREVA